MSADQRRPGQSAKQRRDNGGLSDAERAFIANYVESGDLADGAKAAGSKSVSRKVLKVMGFRIRHRPHVAAEISRIHAEMQQQAVMTRREILMQLADNAEQARDEKQYAASNQALKMLGSEQHKMFSNDVVVSGPGGGPIEVTTRSALEAKLDELGKRLSSEPSRKTGD